LEVAEAAAMLAREAWEANPTEAWRGERGGKTRELIGFERGQNGRKRGNEQLRRPK